MVRLAQTVHLSCVKISTVSKRMKSDSTWALHASKLIYVPMLRLVQAMQLFCIETNSISKWTKTRFHMTHITLELHPVPPKQFLSLWYFSAQTVHLSCVKISTILKQTKMSLYLSLEPRSAIRCVENDFCAYGILGANCALTLALSPNGPKWDST
jgi:hypothetical protein